MMEFLRDFEFSRSTLLNMRTIPDYGQLLSEAKYRVELVPLLAVAGILLLVVYPFFTPKTKYGIPVAGYFSHFEPAWLLRLRFIRGSRAIIRQGYEQYRDLFVIRRWSHDVVVIGEHRYLEEIRAKTKDNVRSVEPFLLDLCGDFFKQGQVFLESDLQNRVLQHKLTPSLANLVPIMKSELGHAMQNELPSVEAEDWTEVDIIHVFARTIARIVARIWIGPDECRNEDWLAATTDYTEAIFTTGFLLRFVPSSMRPFVAPMLPSYRTMLKSISDGRRIVQGLVAKRAKGGAETEPNDVLQWTVDMANDKELEMDNLSQRILILSLSAIHTTALTMAHVLFDLCAHPEHFEPIRTELVESLRAEGEWNKTTLQSLTKMDSLLKESQRISPVFLMTYNRFLPHDVTLSNGIHLPARTRIAVPQNAIINDPRNVPGDNPAQFDPWRYARLREEAQNPNKFHFAMTDPMHMAFGYGKYACPGRFFVANEIKMTLGHLLLRYDWKFPQGKQRPQNFTIDSDMYPDPTARVLMRKRTVDPSIASLVAF